jgi:hypothetical protein
MNTPDEPVWIQTVKARGLAGLLAASLDVFEPFAPLGAQVMWVLQPALSLVVSRERVATIARLLEEPGELELVRQWLEDDAEL